MTSINNNNNNNNNNNSGLKTIQGNFGACQTCLYALKKVEPTRGVCTTTEEVWDQACPCSYMGFCEWLMLEHLIDTASSSSKKQTSPETNMYDVANAAAERGELVLFCERCNMVVSPQASHIKTVPSEDDATDIAITNSPTNKDWRSRSDNNGKKKRRRFRLFKRRSKQKDECADDEIQASRST